MGLRPKRIIVIGGASGIGLATADELLKQGAESVLLASRGIDKLNDAKNMLHEKYPNQNIFIYQFDITNIQSHKELFEYAYSTCNNYYDGLVISSGINFSGSNWRGFNISEEDYDKVMNINLKGPFFLIRNYSDYIYEMKEKANICVVSSISAHRDLLSVYQFSKTSLSGIVRAYGKHLVKRGVVLNAVEPGTISTDMQSKMYTDGKREGKEWPNNALGRMIRAEEIAEAICFLMSDLSETMSGTCLLVSGGVSGLYR